MILLGKLKGKNVDRVHYVPYCNVKSSSIKVRLVVKRLVQEKEKLEIDTGPMISDHNGVLYSSSDLNALMHEVLEK